MEPLRCHSPPLYISLLQSSFQTASSLEKNEIEDLYANLKQDAFEKCWAHSPLRDAARRLFYIGIHQVSLLSHRHCRTPPAHRCPQQQRQQRQPVTEGTATAPWNGPNKVGPNKVSRCETIWSQLLAVRQGHIDGAATLRMLLKQRWQRHSCRFGQFLWPYGHVALTSSSGLDFQHGISCLSSVC